MTLYSCPECRNWHNGIDHVCGPKAPDLRDQRTLERAVVACARKVDEEWTSKELTYPTLMALHEAIIELNGLDRPLLEEA